MDFEAYLELSDNIYEDGKIKRKRSRIMNVQIRESNAALFEHYLQTIIDFFDDLLVFF